MTALPTYDIESKDYDQLSTIGRIFRAMYKGAHLSTLNANDIGETSDGSRYIRFIREDGHPVETEHFKSKRGGTFYRYYFSPEHIKTIKDQIKNA